MRLGAVPAGSCNTVNVDMEWVRFASLLQQSPSEVRFLKKKSKLPGEIYEREDGYVKRLRVVLCG